MLVDGRAKNYTCREKCTSLEEAGCCSLSSSFLTLTAARARTGATRKEGSIGNAGTSVYITQYSAPAPAKKSPPTTQNCAVVEKTVPLADASSGNKNMNTIAMG